MEVASSSLPISNEWLLRTTLEFSCQFSTGRCLTSLRFTRPSPTTSSQCHCLPHLCSNGYRDGATHSLSLNPPDDYWYMDTGATSHMTSNQGTFSCIFNSSTSNHIIVGNGNSLPVTASGTTQFLSPFSNISLHNVLVVPNCNNQVNCKDS